MIYPKLVLRPLGHVVSWTMLENAVNFFWVKVHFDAVCVRSKW